MNTLQSSLGHRFASGLLALSLLGAAPLAQAEVVPYSNNVDNDTAYNLSTVSDNELIMSIDSGTGTQSGIISGAGAVEKIGAGGVILSGVNTYTGTTTLSAGTLGLVGNSAFGDSNIIIKGGTTLSNVTDGSEAYIARDLVSGPGVRTFQVDGNFSIDVKGDTGALENFADVSLTSNTTITFTGSGLACFGGVISGNSDLRLVSANNDPTQVMFCSDTANTFTGLLQVGTGVVLELEKIGDGGAVVTAVAGNMNIDTGATVKLWTAGQIKNTSTVTVNGLLENNSATEYTINKLEGLGTVDNGEVDLTVNSGSFSGNIIGGGQLIKKTADTLTLSRATIATPVSSYSGGTIVAEGTLLITDVGPVDSVLGSGGVEVQEGATLGGTGTVLGSTTIAGTLAPGTSPGEMIFADDLILEGTAIVSMELASLSSFDTIVVNGDVTLDGTLNITLLGGYLPSLNDTFVLFDFNGLVTGSFDSIAFNTPGYTADLNYGTGTLTITAVPEPTTWALMALGGLFVLLRQRRKSAALSA